MPIAFTPVDLIHRLCVQTPTTKITFMSTYSFKVQVSRKNILFTKSCFKCIDSKNNRFIVNWDSIWKLEAIFVLNFVTSQKKDLALVTSHRLTFKINMSKNEITNSHKVKGFKSNRMT